MKALPVLDVDSVPGLRLRPATAEDVPVILRFVRELAEFEKLLHELVATEEDLRRTLFGADRTAEVAIAEYQGQPVGYTLFFHNYSTFLGRPGIYIEDIYVTPARRNLGIGLEFMRYVARVAVERGCGRMEWSVLDWNENAIRFYRRLGAEPLPDWTIQRLTGESLRDLASGKSVKDS